MKFIMDLKMRFAKEYEYEDYLFNSKRNNKIRIFQRELFEKMPLNLREIAKKVWNELRPVPNEYGIKGAKPYQFVPQTNSEELKDYFKQFVVFVEETNPAWEEKKKLWARRKLN